MGFSGNGNNGEDDWIFGVGVYSVLSEGFFFFFFCRWMTEQNRTEAVGGGGGRMQEQLLAFPAGNSRTEADCQGNN